MEEELLEKAEGKEKEEPIIVMSIPQFPEEAFMEILSWLPVKSLLRFKCVSKSWYTLLISSQHFINLHLNHFSTQTNNLSLLFPTNSSDVFHLHHPIDFYSPNPHPHPHRTIKLELAQPNSRVSHKIVGSCNGLICISISHTTLFLVNPSTLSYTQLPDPISDFSSNDSGDGFCNILGFGYSSLTNQYKVIGVAFPPAPSIDSHFNGEVRIHTIGTSSWRTIPDAPARRRIKPSFPAVLVNEYLNWTTFHNRVVTFGIANEKFSNLPLPKFDQKGSIALDVIRGHLCIFHNIISVVDHFRLRFDVWVMNEYGVRESWTRKFIVAPEMLIAPIKILQNGDILSCKLKGGMALYNPRTKSTRDIVVSGIPNECETIDHVDSLVSLN